MIQRPHFVLIAAGLLAASTPAAARSVYFHKPGVDRATVEQDHVECAELAGGVLVNRQQVYSSNPYALAAGSFFAGFFRSRERRGMIDNVMRTCMADKGYGRVVAAKSLVKQLDALADQDRVERLYALSGAPEPQGVTLPR